MKYASPKHKKSRVDHMKFSQADFKMKNITRDKGMCPLFIAV